MAEELRKQLREVGSKLETLPSTKDALLKLLKLAGTCLSELDQSTPKSVLESIKPFLNAIVKPQLLKHQDRDVKLLVATCVCEITRITAPEAPYSDNVLRDIFRLIVTIFSGLSDSEGASFGRRVVILETLARYRSCVVMLDLECDDLVNELFTTFFSVVSDDHSENVRKSMQTIMVVLLEESEDVREDLLLVLLSVLGRNRNDVSKAARRLAMNVIENTAVQLEPGIKQFLISSISGDSRALSNQIDYHEVIYDVYGCAPQILSGVIPYLTGELLTDQLDTRLKAVRLIGDLFSLPEVSIPEDFQPIFLEFLKRLTDRAVEIRMSVLEHVKICLLSNPSRAEVPQIISALCDRLLDYDENVRKQVVAVVYDVACHAPACIPIDVAKLVAERLRDKSLLVKKYTMERLAELHKHYCLGVSNSATPIEFEWIPGKILRCLYDKDFRSDTIDSILCGSLFPTESSVKDEVLHWVRVFSGFDKVEVKALEKILEQKQRLQQEMRKYLSLREVHQDADAPEFQKKSQFCFRIMSRCFADPGKAEENFQILNHLKDANVWKILTEILDPNTSVVQAYRYRDNLLKIVGEKHRLYEFLSTLSVKCSYTLFSKEHVRKIILEAGRQSSAGCTQLASSCMNLLVILARFSPLLLNGTEEDLVELLKDESEVIREGVLHVLAKAGEIIHEQLGASPSSLELLLERICLEGSRRQAKYAVHALAAITKDDGLKSLSVLYKRLVDMLEGNMHLPAVLQSLGCIAQTAMPVFETRESEIQEFIKSKILERSNKVEDDKNMSWDDRSELCSLKIFCIKTMVKSYLPLKDAHLRVGIDKLLGILRDMLSFGEVSEAIKSSSVDKAHLKLASAKAILRLSRHWEHQIPVDIFHLTLRTSEISFPQAKKTFLNKVYQYTKDRLLDAKYSCAFVFSAIRSQKTEFEEDKHNLGEIIHISQQTKPRYLPIQVDTKSEMAYSENILPYLVHVLAHHSSCPDAGTCKDIKAFEQIYRQLHFFLFAMVHGVENGKSETNAINSKESISAIVSTFQSIKSCEDVVDPTKSKNSHAISDLGLLITKRLAGKQDDLQCMQGTVSLPPVLYKTNEKNKDTDSLACEENSWSADESILIGFESLMLDSAETDLPETVNCQTLSDGEGYENDVPLGKMLKLLKEKGSKERKKVKKRSSPDGTEKAGDDVDILKMVREINFDNMGLSSKFEATNGHGDFPNKTKIDIKHKKRRKKVSDAMPSPVPKRPRSSSGQSAFKFSFPSGNSKGFLRPSNDNKLTEMESETHTEIADIPSTTMRVADPAESDLLVSCFRKNLSGSLKRKDKSSSRTNNEAEKAKEIKGHDLMNLDLPAKTFKSPMASTKQKRRSIAGLAKCSSKKGGSHTTDLIDCRIKVWWPMDNEFYEGVVKSYDRKKKKHVVLYDDGDVEVLCLEKENWEVIDSIQKPYERPNLTKSHPQGRKDEQGTEFLGVSLHSKKLKKTLRGKRTPRKYMKHGQSQGKTANVLCEGVCEASSDVSTPEPGSVWKAEDMISGNLEGEQIEEVERNLSSREESDAEGRSDSAGKQMKEPEKNQSEAERSDDKGQPSLEGVEVEDTLVSGDVNMLDGEVKSQPEEAEQSVSKGAPTEESDKEESVNSEGKHADNAESGSEDMDEPDKRTSDSSESDVDEASDNETLSMWTRRSRKSG